MKLLKKGSKLNIIDIALIFVVVAVIAFALLSPVLFPESTETGPETTGSGAVASEHLSQVSVCFTVLCEEVDEVLAESIMKSLESPMDEALAESIRFDLTQSAKEEAAERGVAIETRSVEDVEIAMNQLYNEYKLVNGHVTDVKYEDGSLYFTVDAIAYCQSGKYAVGSQEVRLGREYVVKTLGFELGGTIRTMEITGQAEDASTWVSIY